MPIGKDSIKKRVAKTAPKETAPEDVIVYQVSKEAGEAPITKIQPVVPTPAMEASGEDPKFWDALAVVAANGKVNTSLLQRTCTIGYGRAAKFIDHMEELGLISAPDDTGRNRKVLFTTDDFENYKKNGLPADEAPKAPAKRKTAPPKKSEPRAEKPAPASVEPATAVMGNVSPETVEKVIGHPEGKPSAHVQIGSKMPTHLL